MASRTAKKHSGRHHKAKGGEVEKSEGKPEDVYAGKDSYVAKEAGLTYLPPREPAVTHNISMLDIREQ